MTPPPGRDRRGFDGTRIETEASIRSIVKLNISEFGV